MIDEQQGLGLAGSIFVALATAISSAWATVTRLTTGRIDALAESLRKQAESDAEQRDELREATRRDIQRIEQKIDAYHNATMAHIMELSRRPHR